MNYFQLLCTFSKHEYKTAGPEEMVSDTEESSQELSQGSVSVGSDNLVETEASADCRVCREPILLDSVAEYIVCTQPRGSVHFCAHLVCLGFYTRGPVERKSLRASYRCPRHGIN